MIPPFQSQFSHCICYTCAPLASLLGQALPQPLRFSFGNGPKSKLLERMNLNWWPNHPKPIHSIYGNILEVLMKVLLLLHQPIQPRHGRRPIKRIILRWCLATQTGTISNGNFRDMLVFGEYSKPPNFHGLINTSMYKIDIIKGGSGNLPCVGFFLRYMLDTISGGR